MLDEKLDGPFAHLWRVRGIFLALLHPLKGRSLQDSRSDSGIFLALLHPLKGRSLQDSRSDSCSSGVSCGCWLILNDRNLQPSHCPDALTRTGRWFSPLLASVWSCEAHTDRLTGLKKEFVGLRNTSALFPTRGRG